MTPVPDRPPPAEPINWSIAAQLIGIALIFILGAAAQIALIAFIAHRVMR